MQYCTSVPTILQARMYECLASERGRIVVFDVNYDPGRQYLLNTLFNDAVPHNTRLNQFSWEAVQSE